MLATHPIPFEELWQRADVRLLQGVEVRVAAVADLIAMKELAGRPQDLADIQALRGLGS